MAVFLINLDNEECAKALVAAELCNKMAEKDNIPERPKKKYLKQALYVFVFKIHSYAIIKNFSLREDLQRGHWNKNAWPM